MSVELKRKREDSNGKTIKYHQLNISEENFSLLDTRKLKKMTPKFFELPQIILFHVLEFITKPNLISVSSTCKLWYNLSRSHLLWKEFNFEGFRIQNLQEGVDFLTNIFGEESPIRTLILPQKFIKMSAKDFKRLRSLVDINLTGLELPQIQDTTTSVSNLILKEVSKFSNLKNLNLSTHVSITDEGIEFLTKNLPNLNYINLDYCSSLSLNSIYSIINNCKNIKGISCLYSQNLKFNDEIFEEIIKKLRFLKVLRVQFGDVSSLTIEKFVEQFQDFEEINFRNFYTLNGSTLTKIAKDLKNLKKLTITGSERTKIISSEISNENLTELSIGQIENLKYSIISCPSLKKLNFEQIGIIENVNFEETKSNFDELKFQDCYFSKQENFEKLKTKSFSIFNCRGIKNLKISNLILEDLNLFLLHDLLNLEINCSNLRNFTIDSSMELQNLFLKSNKLEKSQIFCLQQERFPKLKNFYLESNQLENISLQRCIHLKNVNLIGRNLNSVNLGECQVLEQLSLKCESLKKLALSAPNLNFSKEFLNQLNCDQIVMLSLLNISSLSDETLKEICMKFNFLQALILTNCNSLKEPTIFSSNLKGFQISNCQNLKNLNLNCPNLSKLILKNIPSLVDASFDNFEKNLRNLKLLEIYDCNSLESPNLIFSNLTHLKIQECSGLKEPIISCLNLKQIQIFSSSLYNLNFKFQNLNLLDVHFENCLYLNDSLIENLLKNSPNLMKLNVTKNISICQPKLYSNSLQNLSFFECQNLKNLVFNEQEDDQSNFSFIPPLKYLSFRYCPNLNFDTFSKSKKLAFEKNSIEFIECSNLKNLSIESDLLTIISCPNLKTLNFESNGKISIISCSLLTEISFSQNSNNLDLQVKDCNNLSNVISNNSLKSIQLSNCRKYSDSSLDETICKSEDLHSLIIENCSLIKPFIRHSNLSKFHLRKCFHLIDFHTECPNLEEMEIFDLPNLSKSNQILKT
eukprot:gene1556-12682_t